MPSVDDIWNQTMPQQASASPSGASGTAPSVDDIWNQTMSKSATPTAPMSPKTFWQRQAEIPGDVENAMTPDLPNDSRDLAQGVLNRVVTGAHSLGNMATFGLADKAAAGIKSAVTGDPYSDIRAQQNQQFGGLAQQYPASNFAGGAAGVMAGPGALTGASGALKGANVVTRAGKALVGASAINAGEQAGNADYSGSTNLPADIAQNAYKGATDYRNLLAPALSLGADGVKGALSSGDSGGPGGIDQFKFQSSGSPNDATFAQDVLKGKYGDTARTRALGSMANQYGQVQDAYGNFIGDASKTDIGQGLNNKVIGDMNDAASVQGAGGSNYQMQDAFNKSTQLAPGDVQDIGSNLKGYLSKTNMDVTPGAEDITKTLSKIANKFTTNPEDVNLDTIGQLRQSIQDSSPNSALGQQHAQAFDDMVHDTLAKSQGQDVADNYKYLSDNARDGYASFKNTFEGNPSPLIKSIVGNNVTPESIADTISNTSNPQDIDEIMKFAPKGSPENDLIKQAIFKDLQNNSFDPDSGKFNYGKMAAGTRAQLLNNASNLSKIFSPDEMAQIEQMQGTMQDLAGAKPAGGNASSGFGDKIEKLTGLAIPGFVKDLYFNNKAKSAFSPDTTAPIVGGGATISAPAALSQRTQATIIPPNTPAWRQYLNNKPALSQ